MIKKLCLVLLPISFMTLALTACDGYPKSTLRYLDTTDTIRGIDEDNNGIRDDLDIYINTTPFTAVQKRALSQYAESLQSSLLIDSSDKKAVLVATDIEMRALSCIFEQIPRAERESTNVIHEIIGATFNTSLRKKTNNAKGKTLDGSVIHAPDYDTAQACDS